MRIIRTRIHGLLDYIVAIILIAIPWLLDFAGPNSATYMLTISGSAIMLYSLLTNYEWGMLKIISMPTHIRVDMLLGSLLALSPWLFGFGKYIFMPHLLLGILILSVAMFSRTMPEDSESEKLAKKRARFYR